MLYEMFCVVISGLNFVWVLSVRSWKSMAFIEASLKELPVRAELGQSCLATKISAPGPSLLGGSATIGLGVAPDLPLEASLNGLLVCSTGILEAEHHGVVAVGPKRSDEGRLLLIRLL
jgi:hypothetical protein